MRPAISVGRAARLLIAVTLVQPGPAVAQWYLGFEAGPTYATWGGSYVEASGTWGASFAAVVERHVGAGWTVSVSGVWQQKGAFNVRTTDGVGPADFKSSHLEVPVTVGRGFSLSDAWTVRPYAGVAVALTVDCQVKDSSLFEFDEDCGVAIPATDPPVLQVDVPVGLRMVRTFVGGSRLVARVQYQIGMAHLLPDLAPPGEAARGRTWLVAAGFALPLS